MDRLTFGLAEVTRWAQFSGDYNPIHFDRESALQAGLEDLVVHGMLALLEVKRRAAHALGAPSDAARPWLRFNALLRNAVPHGAVNDLTFATGRHGAVDFRVSGGPAAVERFRGSFGPCAQPDTRVRPSAATVRFSADDLARFRASYPDQDDGWIALDALVFSDFMRHRIDRVAKAAESHLAGMGGQHGCFFVQASHTVCIDPEALGRSGALRLPCEELQAGMGEPDVLASSGKVVGTVSLPVFHRDRLVMQVELGLLARPRHPISSLSPTEFPCKSKNSCATPSLN